MLLRYLGTIRQCILSSVPRLPPIMRSVFKTLRERIEERWPGSEHEVSISYIVFLQAFYYVLSCIFHILHPIHVYQDIT